MKLTFTNKKTSLPHYRRGGSNTRFISQIKPIVDTTETVGETYLHKSLENNYVDLVPHSVYQVWQSNIMPIHFRNKCLDLRKKNPTFEYHLFTEKTCDNFIKDNFDKDIYNAYSRLKHFIHKAELWKYCILYKLGGIYIDVKYTTLHSNTLKHVLSRTHYIQDKMRSNIINNDIIVCIPQDSFMKECIDKIVYLIKNDIYEFNLTDTMSKLSKSIKTPQIMKIIYSPHSTVITMDDVPLFIKESSSDDIEKQHYNNSENIQHQCPPDIYSWCGRDLYKYKYLQSVRSARVMDFPLNYEGVVYYPSTPHIFMDNGKLYCIQRRITWNKSVILKKGKQDAAWATINILSEIDITHLTATGNRSFIKDSDTKLLSSDIINDTLLKKSDAATLWRGPKEEDIFTRGPYGFEDIRVTKHNGKYLCYGTKIDRYDECPKGITIFRAQVGLDELESNWKTDLENRKDIDLTNTEIIVPEGLYDYKTDMRWEKNWQLFTKSDNTLSAIYDWGEKMVICDIDLDKKILKNYIYKELPKHLVNARGSSGGVWRNDELWLIIHQTENFDKNLYYKYNRFTLRDQATQRNNYRDRFVVLNKNLDIVRYSEPFKYGAMQTQFCTSFIFVDTKMLIGYSLDDDGTYISEYEMTTIESLEWFTN